MPIQSTASRTGLLVAFGQTSLVSTWLRGTEAIGVLAKAFRKVLMKLTMASGWLPTPALFATPVAELRYRSSLPMETPMTRSVKDLPYLDTAFFRALTSLSMLGVPEVHTPRRIDVLVSMAASKASMGSSVE